MAKAGDRPRSGARNSPPDSVPGSVLGPIGSPWLAILFAWLVPGAGHAYLGRRARGLLFFALVTGAVALGCWLQGDLPTVMASPLRSFYVVTSFGAGIPYLILRFLSDYGGEIRSAGFEYGTAFLVTAGLMNTLLILDAWEIASGRKA